MATTGANIAVDPSIGGESIDSGRQQSDLRLGAHSSALSGEIQIEGSPPSVANGSYLTHRIRATTNVEKYSDSFASATGRSRLLGIDTEIRDEVACLLIGLAMVFAVLVGATLSLGTIPLFASVVVAGASALLLSYLAFGLAIEGRRRRPTSNPMRLRRP